MSGTGVGMKLPSLAGVAIMVLVLAHAGMRRRDFMVLYALDVWLALLLAILCIPVNTPPQRVAA